jgi:hypothetical protein
MAPVPTAIEFQSEPHCLPNLCLWLHPALGLTRLSTLALLHCPPQQWGPQAWGMGHLGPSYRDHKWLELPVFSLGFNEGLEACASLICPLTAFEASQPQRPSISTICLESLINQPADKGIALEEPFKGSRSHQRPAGPTLTRAHPHLLSLF